MFFLQNVLLFHTQPRPEFHIVLQRSDNNVSRNGKTTVSRFHGTASPRRRAQIFAAINQKQFVAQFLGAHSKKMYVCHSNKAPVCRVSQIYASKSLGCCLHRLLIALHPVTGSHSVCLSVCLSVCRSACLPPSFSASFCALLFSPTKTRFEKVTALRCTRQVESRPELTFAVTAVTFPSPN